MAAVRLRTGGPVSLVLALGAFAACSAANRDGVSAPPMAPVSLPDLSRADRSVADQARQRMAAVTSLRDAGAPADRLAAAYGELGKLMLAAEFFEAAEPCLRNAQALASQDVRWPYYLGHVYRGLGRIADGETAFERVLALRPGDVPALVWLGRVELDDGHVDRAAGLFAEASARGPDLAAVRAGLGRVALARRDYLNAIEQFTRALALDPDARSLHAPLAAAYRSVGDTARAEAHQREWRNGDIAMPDPLHQELDVLLENGLSNQLRGVRALDARDWTAAAGFFRRGVELTPENTALRRALQHQLGTALALGGDAAAAREQFEAVLQAAPASGLDEPTAKAHYSLAVMLAGEGHLDPAIRHFEDAVRYRPDYLEARVRLAEALRQAGRFARSLPHYQRALDIDPSSGQARLGYAMSLIRLGRFATARDVLDEGVKRHPDHPEFAHTLARLLVVVPDGRVRNGARALQLLEQLFKGARTTELGETMAMALAETGDFRQAVTVQRGVLTVVRRAGDMAGVRRIEENLRLYESGRPCRTFWTDETSSRP